MDGIKHSARFAETERLMSDYFHCHIAPVMSKTQAYLAKRQGEEMKEYSTSLGGILSTMASAAQPMNDPYQTLKVTGEWNSKTTEDYLGMCKTEIAGSKELQQDLAYIAGQWRDTVIQEIGRARYDKLSGQLGGDLAYAYMDYRMEELMIDRMVKERMPKSSADYIIRKAAESSLVGIVTNVEPFTVIRRNRSAWRSSLPSRQTGERRRTRIGRICGCRHAGRCRVVGLTGKVHRGRRGYLSRRLALRAVEARNIVCGTVHQQGGIRQRTKCFRRLPQGGYDDADRESALLKEANEQLNRKIPLVNFNFSEWMNSQQTMPFWTNVFHKKEEQGTGRPDTRMYRW